MDILEHLNLNCYPESTQYRGTERMMDDAESPKPDLAALRTLNDATWAANSADFDANRWQSNGIAWFIFSQPNDTLRLDRLDSGYCPTLGALIHFHAIAYRFGLTLEQAHELFDAERIYDIDGGEKTTGAAARLKFAELLADFIASNEEGGGL